MSFISKIIVFITVLFSMIMPGDVNKAPVTVDEPVTSTYSVIKYTYTNETGYMTTGDSRVEKLEVKAGDSWVEVPVADEATDAAIEVYPGKTCSDSYDAGVLLPGTYKLTVGYNVVTAFDGSTTVGYSSVEFEVALR